VGPIDPVPLEATSISYGRGRKRSTCANSACSPVTPDTLRNSLYIDAAVTSLETGGLTIFPEIRARLSPLIHEHINFHGRYPIVRSHGTGPLRPLREPGATEE
jgi:hypothetical protein